MEDRNDKLVDICLFSAIIIVIILKLTGIITISWIVLLSPVWILFILVGSIMIATFTITIVKGLIEEYKERKNERY